LLTAAVAVWLAYGANRQRIADLSARNTALRPLARALVIGDPKQIAVVKLQETWMDDERWDLFLPAGRRYRISLATRGIVDKGLAPAVATSPLSPGRHQIALERLQSGDTWRIAVTSDKTTLLTAQEPKDWNTGSSSTTVEFTESTQLAADRPVVLLRTTFAKRRAGGVMSTSSDEPSDGLLLWIQPEGAAP
jgi:hypothetical protein